MCTHAHTYRHTRTCKYARTQHPRFILTGHIAAEWQHRDQQTRTLWHKQIRAMQRHETHTHTYIEVEKLKAKKIRELKIDMAGARSRRAAYCQPLWWRIQTHLCRFRTHCRDGLWQRLMNTRRVTHSMKRLFVLNGSLCILSLSKTFFSWTHSELNASHMQ